MATLCAEKGLDGKPNGCWRLQFFVNGKRHAIRPGAMSVKDARELRGHVTELEKSARFGVSPKPTTLAWLAGIGDDLLGKLAAKKLCAARMSTDSAPTTITVRAFLDRYLAGKAVKSQTIAAARQPANKLCEYLDSLRPDFTLADMTRGVAKDFCAWLKRGDYAEATVARWIVRCREFFADAIDRDLIGNNPFAKIRGGSQANEERFRFIDRSTTQRLIDAAPDAEWRLIIALARYAGVRTPSETFALTWGDVDWDRRRMRIPSVKTAHCGKGSREIPLFPELRPYLESVFDTAAPGTVHVVATHRLGSCNLRTQLMRIIRRAGLEAWPRLFHNLRASRQNELMESHPIHVVCDWIGNSALIAGEHYLHVRESDFDAALESVSQSGALSNQSKQSRANLSGNGAVLNAAQLEEVGCSKVKGRPLPDSNRGWRICNPLPYHLAKGPNFLGILS